ncbi:hypothetical protein FACS1894214_5100 [Planctomycetales bacterium]|nr:hypothetical protein FACS1894214_5100 [Planctomycetales bacterium]
MVSLGRGNRPVLGYCTGIENYLDFQKRTGSNIKLKPVNAVIDEHILLDEHLLSLAHWISEYYLCPLGQVLEAMLPAGVRSSAGTRLATVLSVVENVEQRLAVLKRTPPPEDGTKRCKKQEGFLTPVQMNVLEVLRRSAEPLTSIELQRIQSGRRYAQLSGLLNRPIPTAESVLRVMYSFYPVFYRIF